MYFYNDNEPYVAAWGRNLIKEGLVPDGIMDEKSIKEIQIEDLHGYTQCHFFSGILGWPLALKLAGFPEDRECWSGSCPCQPFSAAGKQKGFEDERHLWPDFLRLIAERRPATIFGEQVAAATDWLRLVRSDLEALGYAVGCLPVQAASAGADHLRDRFWFVADNGAGRRTRSKGREEEEQPRRTETECAGDLDLAYNNNEGSQGRELLPERAVERITGKDGVADASQQQQHGCRDSGAQGWYEHTDGSSRGLDDPEGEGTKRNAEGVFKKNGGSLTNLFGEFASSSETHEWVFGADGKARRVKSDFRLLSHGFSNRMAGCGSGEINEANQRVKNYGQTSSQRPSEVLFALWKRILQEPTPYEALGEQAGICQAEVLLSFLCKLDWGGSPFNLPVQSQEEFENSVRSVRIKTLHARTPYQRNYIEQYTGKYSDTLQTLSWLLAQNAQQAWSSYCGKNAATLPLLENNVPCRVSKLRALGNAIDPRPAAAFIKAFLQAEAEL